MLENHVDKLEMKDMYSEISKQIPLGCNILLPRIVILKPSDLPNCNDNVHEWHISKDMCSTLIIIFSEYGLFNLAATLEVKYLKKFEHVVDY
ncbi:19117_t:CDS:2 [Cetraspora pellucida]|uniref:19117_t:CDS:1 n=1 Tax=Cetraspora pellucida TaxID=1433469 RepID=A0A9N9ISL2_9GLOM|nr:19117_t:CDS:2 [Cetraspora pellucida]